MFCRCEDEDVVEVVRVVSRRIDKLSTRLVECAGVVAEAMAAPEEQDPSQTVQEDAEILRRDWSSQVWRGGRKEMRGKGSHLFLQVHLLTAHVDNLTAKTSAPLDRLVDVALEASRTSDLPKQLLLKKFEGMATGLMDKLSLVDTSFGESTSSLTRREQPVQNARAAISFLKKLTPHAIGAAKTLASKHPCSDVIVLVCLLFVYSFVYHLSTHLFVISLLVPPLCAFVGDSGSAVLEHFNHLRRQWASKGQFLLGNLRKISTANVDDVIGLSKNRTEPAII